MAKIYISAGSNQGDRMEYLRMAAQVLPPAVRIIRSSPVYETEPWGYSKQGNFYNLVWEAETSLDPEGLLRRFKEIEELRIGRVKTMRYGPRVIDLDILLYDDQIYRSAGLSIPHEQIPNRRFVLQPLCDLIPDERDPRSGKTWRELLEVCPPDNVTLLGEPFDASRPIFRKGLKTYCMGIINLTPDSFSGDGLISEKENLPGILDQCAQFVEDGAEILDIGGESTRPGHIPVPEDEEIARILPALREIRRCFPNTLLSVDSGKPGVISAALSEGIDWINNTDLAGNREMDILCATAGVPVIYMRSKPLRIRPNESVSSEKLVERVRTQLMNKIETHLRFGGKRENIILDPGIGFGGNAYFDLEIIRLLGHIRELGAPILVGPSRKSFIGAMLNRPVTDRLAGTAAVICRAIDNGADILRVHDVKFMKDILNMSDLL